MLLRFFKITDVKLEDVTDGTPVTVRKISKVTDMFHSAIVSEEDLENPMLRPGIKGTAKDARGVTRSVLYFDDEMWEIVDLGNG